MTSPAWSTTDFLLQGRFCPVPAIRRRLEALAHSHDAQAALLLVSDNAAVLRTLCLFAGSEDAEAMTVALQAALVSATRPPTSVVGRTKLQDLIRVDRQPDASSRHRFPRSLDAIVGWLQQLVELPASAKRDWFAPGHEWVALEPIARQHGARIATAVLVSRPAGPAAGAAGVPVLHDRAAAADVAEMVSCTVQADVRRDAITSARVDTAVDWSGITLDRIGFETVARQLVELAAEVSRCNVGALYLREDADGDLARVAFSGDGAAPELRIPARVMHTATTALRCIERNRAVQHPSNQAEGRVVPTFPVAAERMAGWAELATPVLGPSANMSLPPAGVLVVGRAGKTVGGSSLFGSYDHAILRNVALRLTLLRSATNMEEVARSYSAPSTRLTLEEATPGSDETRARARHPLPADLRMALPRIREALVRVVGATNSHSGTFRAALPDRSDDELGLALVRVAAHPSAGQVDATRVQRRSDGGKNWESTLTGKRLYAPRVRDDPDYRAHRPDTASELTVPVRVEERVIGVINLESRDEDTYAAHAEAIQLLATHIGHSIGEARLILSRDLQALAIQIVTSAHDFAGDAKGLDELARQLDPATTRDELLALADTIDRRARTLREVADEPPPSPGTFPELVTDALRGGPEMGPVEITRLAWPVYEGEDARSLSECLRHVVANVKEHAATSAGTRPRGHITGGVWGGRDHDVLHLTHRVNPTKLPSDQRACEVYRVPLATDDGRPASGRGVVRPRFGAYLAGMQARRLGGDVWLTVLDDEEVRVTLAIPRSGFAGSPT
jgi:GAF domain-containing protein